MSKKELKKWENKFNFYRKLHPEIQPRACHSCPQHGDMHNCCYRFALSIDLKDGKMSIYDFENGGVRDRWCVEWIKYV